MLKRLVKTDIGKQVTKKVAREAVKHAPKFNEKGVSKVNIKMVRNALISRHKRAITNFEIEKPYKVIITILKEFFFWYFLSNQMYRLINIYQLINSKQMK